MPVKTKPLIQGFAKNRFLEISYSIPGHCEIIPRHFFYGSSLQSLQHQSQISVKLFVGLRKYTWKVHNQQVTRYETEKFSKLCQFICFLLFPLNEFVNNR